MAGDSSVDLLPDPLPSLEQLQRWTRNLGRAQQILMEHALTGFGRGPMPDMVSGAIPAMAPAVPHLDVEALVRLQGNLAQEGLALWQRFIGIGGDAAAAPQDSPAARRDRRFADPSWSEHPFFDFIRQSYLLISDYLVQLPDSVDGLDAKQKEQIRFATRGLVDALAPSNFPLTNPQVIERTIASGGENLVRGLEHMLDDLEKGQLTQADRNAFRLGENIAATPGKVIKETPLYQLIQYTPTTKKVLETPLIIFPPWINRFYILDLGPEKSFVQWAVDQGITVFMVSWKSADEHMREVGWDDYIVRGQIDAIDTVRELLDVPSVHTLGYCVAGTTLAATLALLAARGQADKVASATFLVAQVDFRDAGDLSLFIDDEVLKLIDQLSAPGYLDGRFMAATFNTLRARDLVWSYVVDNYLLGKDYAPFDLLYWNGDTTNLPTRFMQRYLADLYRDNLLVTPGALNVEGTPIDLRLIETPSYVHAAREDHISPPASVWKLTEHLSGPQRFVLAGSGHIAGVINPPAKRKYQYWTCDGGSPRTLEEFLVEAKEQPGSWWPDWRGWLGQLHGKEVPAKNARKPGKGALPALDEAPGSYVKTR